VKWTERFAIVASILEVWRALGSRVTYAIELAKVLDTVRPLAAAIGERPPMTGGRSNLVEHVERWAAALLAEELWNDGWRFRGEDILPEIMDRLEDSIIEAVQAGDYPVGHTTLEDFSYRLVDRDQGLVDFEVRFSGEHPKEDFSFDGRVEGAFRFDPDASTKEHLLDSVELEDARVSFDLDE
jgi:hypothetical protein